MGRFQNLEIDSLPIKRREKESKHVKTDDFEKYLKLGNFALENGFFEEAITLYSYALKGNLKLEKAWLGQILALIELGEYKEAAEWSDRALEFIPNSARIIAAKGIATALDGDLKSAHKFIDMAMKKSPYQDEFLWIARGEILLLSRDFMNAERSFQKAKEIMKNDWKVYLRIGSIYYYRCIFSKAKENLLIAKRLNPKNPLIYYKLGNIYRELAHFDRAKEYYSTALQINRKFREAKRSLNKLNEMSFLKKLYLKIKAKLLYGGFEQ